MGGLQGHFELNVFKPLIAHNLLFSMELLAKGCRRFADKCVVGLRANRKRCQELIEKSLMLCTALAPRIGYDAAAKLAQEAYKTGKTYILRPHDVEVIGVLQETIEEMPVEVLVGKAAQHREIISVLCVAPTGAPATRPG